MFKLLPLLLLVACTPTDDFKSYVVAHNCVTTNDGITAVCNDPFYRWIAPRD